jgi:hypothetical protein
MVCYRVLLLLSGVTISMMPEISVCEIKLISKHLVFIYLEFSLLFSNLHKSVVDRMHGEHAFQCIE